MMQDDMQGVEAWVAWLGEVEIPVLEQTARELAQLRADQKHLDARNVSQIVARDPLMAIKLLRACQRQRRRSEFTEVLQIERAIIMMGMDAFYDHVPTRPLVEDLLCGNVDAMTALMRAVRRARRAAHYAGDWAVLLHDLHFDEVRAAANLHDFTEMLLWCVAPQRMLRIAEAQRQDASLRSRDAQHAVLGFALAELQIALARQWGLPELLLTLMDDACRGQQRVRNVVLAVNLARHAAHGWDDAALPDDYREIGQLLRIPVEQVKYLVGTP